MTKNEALALGVPEERIKDFQEKCGRDLQKAIRNTRKRDDVSEFRSALASLLPLISVPEHLNKLLKSATYFYLKEQKQKKGSGAVPAGDPGNTDGDGQASGGAVAAEK